MCVYIYIYICVCVCVNVPYTIIQYIYIYIHIYIYIYICIYIYIYIYIYIRAHTPHNTDVCVCVFLCLCVCAYVYVCIYIYIYLFIYLHTYECVCVCYRGLSNRLSCQAASWRALRRFTGDGVREDAKASSMGASGFKLFAHPPSCRSFKVWGDWLDSSFLPSSGWGTMREIDKIRASCVTVLRSGLREATFCQVSESALKPSAKLSS